MKMLVTFFFMGIIGLITYLLLRYSSQREILDMEPDFSERDFTVSKYYNKNTYLAIDEKNAKIAVFTAKKTEIFSFDQVLDVRLMSDKYHETSKEFSPAIFAGFFFGLLTYFSASLGLSMIGVAVGRRGNWYGLYFSASLGLSMIGVALGIIIGGIFTASKQVEKTENIGLELFLNDATYPVVMIPFIALSDAEQWEKELKAIIQKYNPTTITQKSSTNAVADEVRKLHQLMLDGIISETEFQTQKARLLGG